ncbi:MAG: hypothetical protein JW810_14745 [Sedimentisphaerales bacterium]|nr:hypothetical protein [Sedimentisphaerales bacterium]
MPDLLLMALFTEPMDLPTRAISLLWVLPICLSVAVVYKAVKVEPFRPDVFARETGLLFVTIVGFLIVIALALLLVAYFVW